MRMRTQIIGKQFDEERALYHIVESNVVDCVFAGPEDGESVLKEARKIQVENCSFSLRYPMWHVKGFQMENSVMDDKTRAAIWYASDGVIENCQLKGIKAIRECTNIQLHDCEVDSMEFGWKSANITLKDTTITSEYLFFDSRDVKLEHVTMHGKYSFQYMENLTINNSTLDTKDAFWHSHNVVVKNSIVKGEYLGWYSEGLTLINCKIIGTQPLCYCKRLTLIGCTMEDTDLAFEYSEVEADICGGVDSIKNPKSGFIIADSVGEVIQGDTVMDCDAKILIRKQQIQTV